MKSFGYYFGMFVAATMAFTACKKEITPEGEPQEITHTMTINLGKVDSKTAVVEGEESASYIWTSEDIPCFHVYESTTNAEGKVSKTEGNVDKVTFSEDMTTASLSVSFTGTQSGPYTYSVVYAGKLNTNNNPVIPAEQNPRLDNFDPTADVLISKPIVSDTRLGELSMIMGRVSTINKMTLKGLGEGEKISKVEFTLDKGLSASYVLDSGNYRPNANKTLTLTYSSLEALVGEGGTFPVYFVSAPVDKAAIVSVVVTTDKNVYTKSSTQTPNPFDGKTITFAVGVMKRFGMDMTGCGEAIASSTDYVLVENTSQILEGGEYLVVNKDGTQALGSYYAADKAYFQLTAVKTNEKTITITSEQVNKLTLESSTTDGQFYIRESNGNYLYYTGGDNAIFSGEKQDADSYLWSVGIDKISNIGNTARVLQYNNGNTRFACYKSTMEDVTLYVNLQSLIPALKTPTGIVADAEGKTITVIWDDVENAESYKVTCGDIVETTGDTCYEFTVSEDGLYEISVVATTSDASFKDSAPATTIVRVGDIKKSKAYFSVNGELIAEVEYEEGVSIKFPENPSIPDVEFMGWTKSAIPTPQATAPDFVNTESTVMGKDDITFYAVFATQVGDANTPVQTLAYDTWTYSGSTTDQLTYRLFHSGSYIESAEFDLSTLIKVVVYGGTYGGTSYDKLTIGDGTNTWKSVTVSGKEATGKNIYTDGTPLKGTGKLRITSNSGTSSSNGVRISKVEIFAVGYSDYCTNVVTLSSVAVSGTPAKTAYTVDEAFDPTGLIVTGTYSNGESAQISDGISWICTPSTFDASGNKSVSVTATVKSIKSAEYNVNVTVKTIANTLSATDKSINVNTNLDVTSLFKTNSDADITYTLVENQSGAGTLSGTSFTASAAGTYKVKAAQAVTTKYSAAEATAIITVNEIQLSAPANLKCSDKTQTSLTFTWDAVTNASGYQVSLDGTNYGETQQATSYTIEGLEPGTSQNIYVKAIGNKTAYTDSDAVPATATTKSAGEVTFSPSDFTGEGASGTGGEMTSSIDNVTIYSDMGYIDGTNHIRIYKGGIIKISSTSGTIVKIELTSTASGTSKYGPSKLSLSDEQPGSSSNSGSVTTWTGSANSVEFTATEQYRFNKIIVTCK